MILSMLTTMIMVIMPTKYIFPCEKKNVLITSISVNYYDSGDFVDVYVNDYVDVYENDYVDVNDNDYVDTDDNVDTAWPRGGYPSNRWPNIYPTVLGVT